MVRYYDPEQYKPLDKIEMEDMEELYSTGICTKQWMVNMVAPLLVCMALHGKNIAVQLLLHRYPLVYPSGWTSHLEEDKQQYAYFWGESRVNGSLVTRSGTDVTASFALCFTDQIFGQSTFDFWAENPLREADRQEIIRKMSG